VSGVAWRASHVLHALDGWCRRMRSRERCMSFSLLLTSLLFDQSRMCVCVCVRVRDKPKTPPPTTTTLQQAH
jgi:hypothetical protein